MAVTCSEQDTASEYENSKMSFSYFGHLVGGLRFPKPSHGQIWRFSVMAQISFSQRLHTAGFLLAFRRARTEADVTSYSLIKIAF